LTTSAETPTTQPTTESQTDTTSSISASSAESSETHSQTLPASASSVSSDTGGIESGSNTVSASSSPISSQNQQAGTSGKVKALPIILGASLGGLAILGMTVLILIAIRRRPAFRGRQFQVEPFVARNQSEDAPRPLIPYLEAHQHTPSVTDASREKPEIRQLRAAVADLRRMVTELRQGYGSRSQNSSTSRDQKVAYHPDSR